MSVDTGKKATTSEIHIYVGDKLLHESMNNYSVLYFQKHEETFIAVVSTNLMLELIVRARMLQDATGFIWNKRVIEGWEHNLEVESAWQEEEDFNLE